MCRDCHHHAHGAVGPHRRIGLLKIQALLLSVSTGHQTCFGSPIPLDLKDEEAGQRLLPFRQINLLPHPKFHARFQLLINGYPPPAGIRTRMRLSHCPRRQCVAVRARGGCAGLGWPQLLQRLPCLWRHPDARSCQQSAMELPTIPRRACRQQHRAALADVSGLACGHAASSPALQTPPWLWRLGIPSPYWPPLAAFVAVPGILQPASSLRRYSPRHAYLCPA
jgi:hypothetical protein